MQLVHAARALRAVERATATRERTIRAADEEWRTVLARAVAAGHTIDDAAPLLSKRFAQAHWEFHAKYLNGVKEERPRWKRATAAAEMSSGASMIAR